ncbi:MAG: PAS domain-containing protein [Planctomycetes bacterium]|nr:PAS domain-containing protein [Planctomycetota bacterium]
MVTPATLRLIATPFLLATSLSLGLGWIAERRLGLGAWPSSLTVTAVNVFAMAIVVMRLSNQATRDRRVIKRCLDQLCDRELITSAEGIDCEAISDAEVTQVFRQAHEVLMGMERHRLELEQARGLAEVRGHRAQSELEQLQAILAGLNEPVLAINHFDEIVLCNPCAERVLGFDLGQAETRALESLVRCETLVAMLMETRRRKGGNQRMAEVVLGESSGSTKTYRVACRGLRNEDASGQSNLQGAVAVLTDISAEKVIQKRNAEFVSAVSHEMKAPLSGIKAYVELLADGDAENAAQREEFLDVINAQAERLQRLVENLLNLARIEAGVVDVQKKARSLNELLNEAIGVVAPSAQQKQISLVSDLSQLYVGVHADRDMLLQAAINLLSNAIKYTNQGGKVTLRSRVDDSEVYFEVEDKGVGLSEDDCEKVFEKFYRVKKDKNMAQGTGLGLPLAKHIVEDVHGGRLTLRSELGKGSIFRVSLPNAGRGTSEFREAQAQVVCEAGER